MRIQRASGAVAVLAVFALSGCASAGTPGATASGGSIEVAVAKICAAGSSPDCVEVNGDHVLVVDGDFKEVELNAVAAADDESGTAVDLELTQDGASVLADSTTTASEAGEEARLVIKAGGRVMSAVRVAEPLRDDHVTIEVPDGVTAEEFIAEIRRS